MCVCTYNSQIIVTTEGIKTLALHDINHCSHHTVPATIAAPLTQNLRATKYLIRFDQHFT